MVEGARLERVYRGNSIVGSNPTFSAIAVLDGESAVPCNLQSAIAGLMLVRGLALWSLPQVSGVDGWVLRNANL